jgi:hypothetical protein
MGRYRCFSNGVERSTDALDYEAPNAAKAAASHAAFVYKRKADSVSEQVIMVFDYESGQRCSYTVKVLHTIEFKATLR